MNTVLLRKLLIIVVVLSRLLIMKVLIRHIVVHDGLHLDLGRRRRARPREAARATPAVASSVSAPVDTETSSQCPAADSQERAGEDEAASGAKDEAILGLLGELAPAECTGVGSTGSLGRRRRGRGLRGGSDGRVAGHRGVGARARGEDGSTGGNGHVARDVGAGNIERTAARGKEEAGTRTRDGRDGGTIVGCALDEGAANPRASRARVDLLRARRLS